MFSVAIYTIFICSNAIMSHKKEETHDSTFKSWKKNYDVICCLLIKKKISYRLYYYYEFKRNDITLKRGKLTSHGSCFYKKKNPRILKD